MEVMKRKSKVLRNSFRRLSKKGPSKEKKAEKISKPKRLECYVAVAEYKVQALGELALLPGMKVEVLEKNDIGWWFVNSEDEQGWVPSTYLEPDEGTCIAIVPRALPGEEEMFVCIEDFEASGDDEVSLEKGVAVSVIQKNMDGWWLVRYQGKEAFAPGTYLKKATNATRMSMMEKSRLSGVEIVSSLQDVSTLLNTDKNPQEKNKPEVSLPDKPVRSTIPSALIKHCSLERGGSLKPPPRQNSVKKMERPVMSLKSPIYVTIADFTDTVGDGISFKEGEKVLVQEKTGTGWWLVKLGQEEGWVPASYLESYSGKMDTPTVYELAKSQDMNNGDNMYEENNESVSDDDEWYTEPDDMHDYNPVPSSLSSSQSSDRMSKRPLPDVPNESGDYEPVAEVKNNISPLLLPPPPPLVKGDKSPLVKENNSNKLSPPSINSNLGRRSPPVLLKSEKDKDSEKPKVTPGSGSSDLASVLRAKFESRTGTPGNEGETEKIFKPVVPSQFVKPSEVKKFQKDPMKPSLPPTPNKPASNKIKPGKPTPPSKSKSPNIFQNAERKSENPPHVGKGAFPKVPLKPAASIGGIKNDAKQEKNDVKNMAAIFNKSLKPCPSAGESVTPAKVPVAPKPQIANKPKPSVPSSKPSLAAKPKPPVQPKSSSQSVGNIASALSSKLNFNNINDNDDNRNREQNASRSTATIANTARHGTKLFVALFDFVGESEGELSFNEGDSVEILEDNGDWVFVQLGDEQGWAPSAYFKEI